MEQQAKDMAIVAAVVVLMAAPVVWMLMRPLPYVYWSTANDACVRVEPATAGSCTDLPERYEQVWVR